MKKIFVTLTVIGLMVFAACSSEQDVNVGEDNVPGRNMRQNAGLQSKYDDMIASASYLDYKGSLDSFLDNLNSKDDFSSFDEDDLMDWISTNIGQTDFVNFQQAEDSYKSMQTKYNYMVSQNPGFFEELQLADKGDFLIIIDPIHDFQPAGECEDGCNNTLSGCSSSATAAHAAAMEAIYSEVDLNDDSTKTVANKKASFQLAVYHHMLNVCSENHQNCLVTCLLN